MNSVPTSGRIQRSLPWHWRWIDALLALTLLCGVAGAVNLWRDIGQPFGGYMAMNDIQPNTWRIDEATPPWWPGVNNTALGHRDTLLTINGDSDMLNQSRTYQAARARGETTVAITADHLGTIIQARVPILTFTARDFFEIKLPDLIIAFSFWLLAVVIYRLRPTDPLNRTFAIMSTLTAALIIGWRQSLFEDTAHFGPLLWLPEMLGLSAAFICPTAIYAVILLTSPEPGQNQIQRQRIALWIGCALALLVTLMWWASRGFFWTVGWTPLAGRLDGVAYVMALIGGAGCIVFVLLRLMWSLGYGHTLPRVRKRALGILIGIVIALPMVVMNFRSGLFIPGSSYCCGGLDLRYLYLAIPLAFAFVILRHQAFRGTHPLFVLVLLLTGSALLASIGDWLVRQSMAADGIGGAEAGFAGGFRSWIPPFVPLLAIIFTASVAGAFLPQWLSRVLRWESTSYGAVRQFGQEMLRHRLNLASLPQEMATSLVSTLRLDQAAIWLWQPTAGAFRLAGEAGAPRHVLPESLSPPPGLRLGRPAHIGADARPVAAWLNPLQERGFEAVALLASLATAGESGAPGEMRVGLLALGKRVDEEIFHTRDLEIIELIAQQAALFLLTAQQIERLREVPCRVTEAQERERFKLAQELHDTIQQFLGRLPFYLQVSRTSVRTRPEQTEALLKRCIADVERAAQTVRQIRGELAPIQLESKLTQPLVELLERFRTRTGLAVQVEIAADIDAKLAPVARHALYRVIQQSLDNVDVHAHGASQVDVTVRCAERQVQFSITDDGRGFAEAERAQAEATGHFGLRSMQARIHSLGGELTVTTGQNRGVTVSGWLPLD
jgi:signal transduction histidine kinase